MSSLVVGRHRLSVVLLNVGRPTAFCTAGADQPGGYCAYARTPLSSGRRRDPQRVVSPVQMHSTCPAHAHAHAHTRCG